MDDRGEVFGLIFCSFSLSSLLSFSNFWTLNNLSTSI